MDATAPAAPLDSDLLWRTLRHHLLRYAQSKVRNRMLAEDAVSEVVMAALQTGAQFESAGHQRAWLIGVLKHKLADEMRRESRWVPLEPVEDDPLGEPASTQDPSADCAGARLRTALEHRCRQLPPAQRAVFTLRAFAELDTDEICARLGISRNHMWVLIHRARRTLQQQLREYR